MRSVFAYPSNMAHAQQAALALLEADVLDAFVTTFYWDPGGGLASFLAQVPFPVANRIARHLARRSVRHLPKRLVHSYPFWELVRSGAISLGGNPVLADLCWDRLSHSFDATIAARYVQTTEAVQLFEYTALASFKRARELGVAKILHVPSLDSRSYEEIQRREKRQWPELFSKHDYYFDSRFERRYARRREEIALADIVVANSSLTARSHIAAGADPQKVVTVPLAAPPPIAESKVRVGRATDPLKVIWAGPFSIRKGAHHLVAAWRQLSAGKAAQLDVYGQCTVPERLSCSITNSVVFRGSVPQKELFDAYQSADVLVFPTLSDGFGMVIAEALAHGLPVVTTDQAGAADLITPDSGLIVPAANPTAIADALRWCLDNRTRLNEMRYHALEAARRRQWVDFRRDLIVNLECGLRQSGYTPSYKRSQ